MAPVSVVIARTNAASSVKDGRYYLLGRNTYKPTAAARLTGGPGVSWMRLSKVRPARVRSSRVLLYAPWALAIAARLRERRVAVIGYGSQGFAQSNNLKDSGVDVTVDGNPVHRLRPGAVLTVRITKREHLTKVVRFAVRPL